jgi:hypothetical protein
MKNLNSRTVKLGCGLLVGMVPAALACDICAVYSAQEAQNGSKGPFAGVAAQYTYFGTLQDNGHPVAANGEYIDSLVSQIYAGYSFNSRFSVQFTLPVIYRAFGTAAMSDSETGLGDVSLTGNLRLWQMHRGDFTLNWSGLGGIKFPTGDSSRLGQPDFAPGIGGHDLALGSGSYDGLVGTSFFARWKRLFLDGQMQYAIRTEGDFQHRYANDWSWSSGLGAYILLRDDCSVALQFTTSGESKGKDTFAGVPDGDSAETIVYLGPEISLTWRENLSAHIGADFPVSIANSGEQLMPDYRIHAGLTWHF